MTKPNYGFIQIVWLLFCKIFTCVFYRTCRLVRLPIFIRNKNLINFGKNLTTGYFCRIDALGEKNCIIFGENVQINDFVHIGSIKSIVIGDNTLIASRVFISDHNHGDYKSNNHQSSPESIPSKRPLSSAPIIIGKNVWIGENVSILPGVIIGNGSIIGAGSIVTTSIPDNSIAAGVPAKVIKQYDFQKNLWKKLSD